MDIGKHRWSVLVLGQAFVDKLYVIPKTNEGSPLAMSFGNLILAIRWLEDIGAWAGGISKARAVLEDHDWIAEGV